MSRMEQHGGKPCGPIVTTIYTALPSSLDKLPAIVVITSGRVVTWLPTGTSLTEWRIFQRHLSHTQTSQQEHIYLLNVYKVYASFNSYAC